MLESAEIFTVQYLAGLAGTLLNWFVNQHNGFPKINLMHNDDNDVALASYATSWVLTDDQLIEERLTYQTFDEVKSIVKDGLNDQNIFHRIYPFNKIAIKTFPHDIINLGDFKEVEAEELIRQITEAGIKKWIYPFIYPDSGDSNVKESIIHRRWASMHRRGIDVDYDLASEKMYECNVLETDRNPFFKAMVEKYDITVYRVDISLLIAGDQEEYERLLSFIDCTPLEDWHEKLLEWAPWVGYRYAAI